MPVYKEIFPSMDTQTAQATPSASPDSASSSHAAPTLKLTERAVVQVNEVIKEQGFEGYTLSIRVVPAGCNGLGYDLNLLKEVKADDILWEQDGVKIATDGLSATYLAGTEVDYVKHDQGAGFKFSNPNAKQSCGCGTSFST